MTKIKRCSHETEPIDVGIDNDGHFEGDEENGVDTLIVTPPSFRERLDAARRARATDEIPAVSDEQASASAAH